MLSRSTSSASGPWDSIEISVKLCKICTFCAIECKYVNHHDLKEKWHCSKNVHNSGADTKQEKIFLRANLLLGPCKFSKILLTKSRNLRIGFLSAQPHPANYSTSAKPLLRPPPSSSPFSPPSSSPPTTCSLSLFPPPMNRLVCHSISTSQSISHPRALYMCWLGHCHRRSETENLLCLPWKFQKHSVLWTLTLIFDEQIGLFNFMHKFNLYSLPIYSRALLFDFPKLKYFRLRNKSITKCKYLQVFASALCDTLHIIFLDASIY